MKSILILGIGNILQKDEGIGVHVVNSLVESDAFMRDDVEIIDGGTAGYDLLPLLGGRKKIVIVDALKIDDDPGSIYRFTPDRIQETGQPFSLHQVGIKSVLDLLRIRGENPNVEIIGIVPEDIESTEIGISDSVKRSIPRVVDEILNSISY